MSYYRNRIDEKMVGKRRTSKLKKELASTKKELSDIKVYHSAAQDQIKKLNRREYRDAKSPVPKDRAFHHYLSKDREDFGGNVRKLKSGEVAPVSPGKRGKDQLQVRKKDATARGSNTQVATGKGSKAKRRMASNVSPREIFMKTIKKNLPQDTWGFTEAVYNAYVDLAYLIEASRKTKPGEPATRVRGKFYRSDSPGEIGYRRSEDGELKPYRKDTARVGLRSQEGYSKRTPEQRKAKHYKRLHQRANAGDKKAMELLRRAEMSGND